MKSSKEKKLSLTIKKYFIYILPSILFFSFYPLILLGSNSQMNFELSLPLIWLLLFSLISLPTVDSFIKNIYEERKWPIFISVFFPIYSTITIILSGNFVRAVLTAGVIWCLWLSSISIIDFFEKQRENRNLKVHLLKIFFATTTVVCLFCWIQCILDTFGVARESSLLCAGCTVSSFGFPHPSGFAIEPQFMGNLLLAPVFLSFYLLFRTKQKQQKIVFCLLSLFFTSTLFLTMSRGAIYAFSIGLALFLILTMRQQKACKSLLVIPIVIFSFLFTLIFQGIFAEASSTNDTFSSGVSKVLNQMSLGVIDIPYELKPEEKMSETETNISQFGGYAEISTTTRLGLSELAFKTWTHSPETFIFGVGIGSGGKAMHTLFPESLAEKEIVQNEYLEIALELGIIGVINLVISLIILVMAIFKTNHSTVITPIILAFLVSDLFFSGLPNALHIFLLPTLLIVNSKIRNC